MEKTHKNARVQWLQQPTVTVLDFRSHHKDSHQKSAVAAPVSSLLDTTPQFCRGDDVACFARCVVKQVWPGSVLAHMSVPLWHFDDCFGLIQQIGWPVDSVSLDA